MLNTNDVVFISNEFNAEQSSKIVRVLNAHEIKTTTDINAATIIVKPAKKPQNNNLIVAVLAQKIEDNTEDIIKMYEQVYKFMPQIEIPKIELLETKVKKHNKFIQNRDVEKFNKIKQNYKRQVFFHRTRNK